MCAGVLCNVVACGDDTSRGARDAASIADASQERGAVAGDGGGGGDGGADGGADAHAGTTDAGDAGTADAGDAGAGNAPPIANAGTDREGMTHVRLALDGSASSDPEGDTLGYAWTLAKKPATSVAALTNGNAEVVHLTPDLPGTYELRLVVSDGTADSDPDAVRVTVAPARVLVVGDTHHPALADRIETGLDWNVEAPFQVNAALVQVSGDFVAWIEHFNSGSDVIANAAGTRVVIAASGSQVAGIDLAGTLLVWGDGRNAATDGMDVYAYDTVAKTESRITSGANTEQQPATNGDAIFWEEIEAGDTSVHGFRVSDSETYTIDDPDIDEEDPLVAGDYVAYTEKDAIGNLAVYGYRISTKTRFSIEAGTGQRRDPIIAGDYVVYRDGASAIDFYKLSDGSNGNFASGSQPNHDGTTAVWWEQPTPGNFEVKVIDLATGTPTTIRSTTNIPRYPVVETPLVAWIEVHPTTGMDVHTYDLTTTTHTVITNASGTQDEVAIYDGHFFWLDGEGSEGNVDLVRLDSLAGVPVNLSGPGRFRAQDAALTIDDYDLVVFGDSLAGSAGGWALSEPVSLALFDAADATGVPVLSFSGDNNNGGLVTALSNDGRLAISYQASSGAAPVAIDASEPTHPIFDGLAVGATIPLHTGASVTMEEVAVETDPLMATSPDDWTELAAFGPAATLTGKSAIVEFTTAAGTSVMLDGTVDAYDGYAFWTAARETLLLNEATYLAGLR